MLNVELLRATQKSIADESKPFDIYSYAACICAHAIAIHKQLHLPLLWYSVKMCPFDIGRDLLGLTEDQAEALFNGDHRWSREQAIAAIQALIDTEPLQTAEGPTTTHQPPVCPARRSSKVAPRAKADITAEEVGELVGVL